MTNKKRVAWNKGKKGYKLHSEESIEKIRKSMQGKKLSQETKNKISKATKGRIPWNKGKTGVYDEETLKKKSESLKGIRRPKEVREKISISMMSNIPWNKNKTGIYSEKTLKLISDGTKGKLAWNKGKKLYENRLDINKIKKRYPFFYKIEEIRYNPNKPLEEKEIQVHCKNHNCKNSKEKGGWFTPTGGHLSERIRQLENIEGNEGGYFYCSQNCKDECPLYNLRGDPFKNTELPYTIAENQLWRQIVLELDKGLCQYCGEPATDVHHIKPVKTHPHLALDPDNGISFCKKCHYKIGHKTGSECSTGNLANKVQQGCKLGGQIK